MISALTILIDLAVLFWIALWLYKKQDDQTKSFYWPALGVKLLAGAAVGWVYFYHYGQGDTISYWHDGVLVSERITSNPMDMLNFFWEENPNHKIITGLMNDKPRSLFFVKISGIVAFLSANNYWMMAIIISTISFLGAWYLFTKTIHLIPSSQLAAAGAFLFWPSIVFWSSGLIKESLGLGSLFFLGGVFLALLKNQKIKVWEWVIAALSLWIGWSLKYYWIGVFMPITITTVMVSTVRRWQPVFARFELAMWVGLFIILLLIVTSVHPNFYPHRFLEVISQNNQEFMKLTDVENAVTYHNLDATLLSVLLNSPQALVAGLFRPFIWEAHNMLSLVAGIENLFLLALVITSIYSVFNLFKAPNRVLTLAIFTYVIILAIFLALATPNLGTLSRYKIGFLPFLVFLTIYQNSVIDRLTKRGK